MTETTAPIRTIAAVGPEGFILGFRLAGVEMTLPAEGDQLPTVFKDVLEDRDVAIVICRVEDVRALPHALKARVQESVDPVFVQLGAGAGAGLRDKVRNAIGIDLFKE